MALMMWMTGTAVQAATAFPALDRDALHVQAPSQQVMQAATRAGQRLVVVGERGIVVLSDDAGGSWRQARYVPTSATLTQVSFVDEGQGWAVGHGGMILHSKDGGESWEKQADGVALAEATMQAVREAQVRQPDDGSLARAERAAAYLIDEGADKPLLDVQFKDSQQGWAVGAYNLFFETKDGGKTWHSVGMRLDNPQALHLYAVRVQGDRVLVAGEQGLIYLSRDGGQSFQQLDSPYDGSWFTATFLPDGSFIVAGLRGNAYRSDDEGRSWHPLEGAPPVSFVASALVDGRAWLANQAGRFYELGRDGSLTASATAPIPPLTGVLPLKADEWLVTTLSGILRLPMVGSGDTK